MSNYSSEMIGMFTGTNLIGYIKNLEVSTTEVQIPLIGPSLEESQTNLYNVSAFANLTVHLSENLSNTITTDGSSTGIKLRVKNLTSSIYSAELIVGVSAQAGSVSGSTVSVNPGDAVVLSVVATGGFATIPFLTWTIN